MTDHKLDYWIESVASSLGEHGISATKEQIQAVAEDIQISHEQFGMAFYSPPGTDRIADIDRQWKEKNDALEKQKQVYEKNAEAAIKRALGLNRDTPISIDRNGDVFMHDGRTEQIL